MYIYLIPDTYNSLIWVQDKFLILEKSFAYPHILTHSLIVGGLPFRGWRCALKICPAPVDFNYFPI